VTPPPPADPRDLDRLGPVLIVGAGLIGASIGCALTSQGVEVHLSDLSPANAIVASSRGAGALEQLAPSTYRLVIVATPPTAVAAIVADRLRRHPNAVVTDVASVKESVLEELEATGADLSRYVGSHPMSGTQFTGPITAAPELFVDRTWVVTPRPDNSPTTVERVRRLARVCGARVVTLGAHEHDTAVAEVSHLPHLMSILTGANLRHAEPAHLALAGGGIRDVTRVARSQTGMWRQILTANRTAVRHQLEGVREDLDTLLGVLDDPDELEDFLKMGRTGARSLGGKHGREVTDTVSVIVEIPDSPGALARLFADVEHAGVNVEDLSVEHDRSRDAGFLSIDVEPGRAGDLRAWMKDHGWGLRS
jgi:prephenate dehydrogenase